MDKFSKAIKLINEGSQINDKTKLFGYFVKYFFTNLFGLKNSMNLKKGLMIENSSGKFYCGNSVNNAWIVSTIHEPEMGKYFDLKKGVFVDIGANIGKYTIKIGNENKNVKIISVEPEPKNFEILKKNVEINKLENVSLENIAIGAKNEEMDFYISESTAEHSIKKKTGKKIKIKVMTLDSILKKNKIEKVDLIKIDVEGAEKDVLLGAKETLKTHPRIIFESDKKNLQDMKEMLKKFNYKVKEIFEDNYLAD